MSFASHADPRVVELDGYSSRTAEDLEPTPLVVVEGFLGGACGALLWGHFEHYLNEAGRRNRKRNRRTIFPRVGPVSSLHDRACELYFSLRGGIVDYGETHSREQGHGRFGRTIKHGLYPSWSPQNPLHFLGHSMGGPTIVKLQHLLKLGHFNDYGGHPDMVLSLSSISAPFRGTQVVYILGEKEDAAPAVKPLSFGSLVTVGTHILSYFSPILPSVFDVHSDARALSFREASFASFLRQTFWRSDWGEGKDATPYDATFSAMDERESENEGAVHPGTFYRSYAASMTRPTQSNGPTSHHRPPIGQALYPFFLTSKAMGVFDFSALKPVPSFMPACEKASTEELLGPEYFENDGVVPLFSQWHPRPCSSTNCKHYEDEQQPKSGTSAPEKQSLKRGVWHVHTLEGANHTSIAPLWTRSQQQMKFWLDVGQWLRDIDDMVASA